MPVMAPVRYAVTYGLSTVIVRKAYGAGYYVMNGRAYEPDLIVAWPSAEICVAFFWPTSSPKARRPGRP